MEAPTYSTLADAFDEACDRLRLEETQNTFRAYRHGIDVFCEYLLRAYDLDYLTAPLPQLTIDHFIKYPAYLARADYSKKTAVVYVAAADYLLERFLVINRILVPDVADYMSYQREKRMLMKKAENYHPRNVAEVDIQKMLDAAAQQTEDEPRKSRDIAIVQFLASSGLRNMELCKLKVRDLAWNTDHDKPFVHIENGKGGKSDDIPFGREAWTAIKTYWKTRGWSAPGDPAFARHDKGAGKKHKPMTTATVRNIVSAIRDLSGIEAEFTPHFFRHGVATRILRRTGNIELARQQLRHTSIGTTALYTHLLKEDLVKAHNEVFD